MRGFGASAVFCISFVSLVATDSGNKRFVCQPEGEDKKENVIITDEMINVINSLIDSKLKELESKLEEKIWQRMMDVSVEESVSDEPPRKAVEDKKCDFKYEDKCYAFFHAELMTYVEAKQRCIDVGGHMANIYSKAHEDAVIKYIHGIDLGPVFFFIGMTLNTETMKVSLHDGSPAPYFNWYSEGGYPKKEHSLIRYTVLPAFHGMFNNVDTLAAKSNGVLCEL